MVAEIPVLEGHGLRLRPHTDADIDAVAERCVDPETVRWTTVPSPYDAGMARDYLAQMADPANPDTCVAIEVDGRYAGTVDLRPYATAPEHAGGSVGFVTSPWARGRQVMTRAMAVACDHAFGTLRWQFVVWQANVGNLASYKAVWRLGFPLPVTVPALLLHRDRMRDGWHSVLEHDALREPALPWPDAEAALLASAATARRPG
ncbi:MAG TPA: GNAT family N-acetyltransferase [Dermatophilaceae bacterium]|nr:GNAT family N-acetyltransferase [Dermatophilaceae bacterium]